MPKTLGQYLNNQEMPLFIGFRGHLAIDGKKHRRIYMLSHTGLFLPHINVWGGEVSIIYRKDAVTGNYCQQINIWEHRDDKEVDSEKYAKLLKHLKDGIYFSNMARSSNYHNDQQRIIECNSLAARNKARKKNVCAQS